MAVNNENRPIALKVSDVKKMYKLGQIGGGTLQADLQSWWAKVRGKEDPNSKIGEGQRSNGDTFMALNGVNLTIYEGEAVGIIGSNGAGKSTLLKLLSRVTAPTEGSIDLYGRVASMLEVGTGFNGELTGRENVYMNGSILGMTKEEIDSKMEDIIEFSEVREFIDTPVKRYSSGMYVKLAFSVAAHLDSEIMIMDEVLAVGDMAFQKKCLDKMRDAAKKEGRTVLYVSHNMNTIRQLCDRCIVLDKGKVVFEGDVEEAIRIYSGVNASIERSIYDLSLTKRPFAQHGQKIHLTRFEFCNKDNAVFERIAPIQFEVEFDAKEDVKALKLLFVIISSNGLSIGTTQTFDGFADVTSGKHYSQRFIMDISNIAAGEYYFQIDLFSDDGAGHHYSYDHPDCNIMFEVVDSNYTGILWQPQYFGSVMLNPLLPVDVGVNYEKN